MTIQAASHKDQTALGILLILASVLAMGFADAMVKLMSADLTLWQIFVTRSVFAIPALAALLLLRGHGFRLQNMKWVLARSGLLVLCWLAFYASLPLLNLSVAAVAAYTNPIMITLLSAALLGEPVSGRQWLGVLLGFAGVLAVLQPGTQAFSWAMLLPLAAAACYALAMVLTRGKCQSERPLALALSLHGAFLVTGLAATALLALAGTGGPASAGYPFLLGQWAGMGAREWGAMALLGLLSAAYFAGVARAYQIAPPPIIAVFDYAYLVSAALWGFVLFAERPGLLTVCGMFLITLAGLLVAAPVSKRVPVSGPRTPA